jgi:PAS domain S-box-containing protein
MQKGVGIVGGSSGNQPGTLAEGDFRALVEQAADGIFISTAEGRYVQVNASGHRLLGYQPGELVGKTVIDVLPAREQARLRDEIVHVAAGEINTGQWTFTRKDGTLLEAEVTAQRLASGRLMAIVRDLGQRKDLEQKVRESEERLRSILETAPDVVMTVDRAGTILFINRTMPPLLPEQVVGTNALDYVPEESRARVEAALERVFTKGELDEYEVEGPPGPNGQRQWSSVRAGPLTEGGRVVAATLCATDLTRRREHEQREARLQEQLRQSQKLESVGRLAGGVAHDFNNLLTSILGYVQMARDGLPEGAPARELLDGAVESAQRAAALTQQLLAFARKKIVNPEVVVLDEVLKGMAPMLRRLVGENLQVELSLAGDLGAVRVDVGSIEQVIMNLVVNAKDAIVGAGSVVLETRNVRLDEDFCREHPGLAPGDHVRLAVRDTGSGMTPDVALHVFEPFFTTKPVGEGTGLGLATCEGIVRQAGGSIDVESVPGVGTTFCVHLPRVQEAPVSAAPAEVARPTARGTETLLVVEDEAAILKVARRVLGALGYAVLTASDGMEALELAARHPGPIDLLITDVVMPRMGGRELAARLASHRPTLRVLYSSGYTADTISAGGVLDEGVDLLQKPYSPADLGARVREVLDAPARRAQASSAAAKKKDV